jgi:hypothetical protein
MIRLRLGRHQQGQGFFSSPSRPHQPPASYLMGMGALTLEVNVKRPWREANHSSPTEVKNAWRYISTPPYVFMSWYLIKQLIPIRGVVLNSADLNSRVVWGKYCLRSFEHWDPRFESCSGHGCVSAFLCVVLSCVQVEALRRAGHPSKESYQLSHRFTSKNPLTTQGKRGRLRKKMPNSAEGQIYLYLCFKHSFLT